jgi:hypothetical protein
VIQRTSELQEAVSTDGPVLKLDLIEYRAKAQYLGGHLYYDEMITLETIADTGG